MPLGGALLPFRMIIFPENKVARVCGLIDSKRPDFLNSLRENLLAVFGREEVEVVAVESDGLVVGKLLEGDWPVGSPHETFRAEGVIEALHLGVRVAVREGLAGKRPDVGDFDEDPRVAGENEQHLELVGTIERTVGHVIDDDDETRISFDQGHEIGQPGNGCEDGHWNLEFGASAPERAHEWAANPVTFGGGCRAEAGAVEALLGELREVIRSGGVFGVDATYAVKFSGVPLQD